MTREILVIDDNSDIRLLISEILREEGFKVREGANFDQALLEINKKLPDVAIIDVKLDKGDNDGIELLQRIKKIDEEIAECLSYCSGRLVLDGIKKIESNPAKWLAKINGTLQLNGLQNIDDSVANKLAEHKGELWLSGIKQLDDNVARNLVKHGSCSDDTSRRRVIEETDTMGKAAPEGKLKSRSQRLLPELNLNGLKNLNDNKNF